MNGVSKSRVFLSFFFPRSKMRNDILRSISIRQGYWQASEVSRLKHFTTPITFSHWPFTIAFRNSKAELLPPPGRLIWETIHSFMYGKRHLTSLSHFNNSLTSTTLSLQQLSPKHGREDQLVPSHFIRSSESYPRPHCQLTSDLSHYTNQLHPPRKCLLRKYKRRIGR